MVELLPTVAPSNMHELPGSALRMGKSPALHGLPRLLQLPSSQRYCVPAWHVADPLVNGTPPYSQLRPAAATVSVQAVCSACQSPSSHLYFCPAWQEDAPSEYIVPL